ncbi:MAG: TRAP transporter large permease subunit [Deltaproteobacteria bacterium]|nr:TRAP transporter large permease subunit [Deltaproteobacteria bacterium]
MALFLATLTALALIGAPLFVLMGTATALCFYLFTGEHNQLRDLLPIMQNMEGLLVRQEFLAIPLFMASGAIMTAGGIARRLVTVARAGLGWLPGGMAVAAVAACMFFAAISGSSPVTLIAVGSIMFPAMVQSKYPENFALGLVTTAGSLGCLVPPSISMLIYAISISGSSAAVSPEDMFLAGLVPALLIGGLLAAYAVVVGLGIPGGRQKFNFGELWAATKEGIWALLLPLLVLGGIYGGLYTPSEAGAVATVYALAVTMLIYRELSVKKLFETLMEAAALMGSLILIIVLAFGLNEFLALIGVQERLMTWIRSMSLGPFGFLLLVNLVLIVIGALMDSISCTLVFAPMLAPVAWQLYGIDPLHFGIVFVVNMEIGYLMPPVATNLFVAAAVFKKPFGQVTRAIFPTLGITCAALALVMYVPTIAKAAVNWKQGKPVYEAFPWAGRGPQVPLGEEEEGAAAKTQAAGVVPAAAPAGKGPDLSQITAKSMAGFDDEDDEETPTAEKAGSPDAGGGAPK